jgi:hypothetical protein
MTPETASEAREAVRHAVFAYAAAREGAPGLGPMESGDQIETALDAYRDAILTDLLAGNPVDVAMHLCEQDGPITAVVVRSEVQFALSLQRAKDNA